MAFGCRAQESLRRHSIHMILAESVSCAVERLSYALMFDKTEFSQKNFLN